MRVNVTRGLLGALVVGWLAQRHGAPVATSFNAIVLLGSALWVAYRLRVLAARELETRTQSEPAVPDRVG